jgi:hypothetical protein
MATSLKPRVEGFQTRIRRFNIKLAPVHTSHEATTGTVCYSYPRRTHNYTYKFKYVIYVYTYIYTHL